MKTAIFSSFHLVKKVVSATYIPPGLAPFCLLHYAWCFLRKHFILPDSDCIPVTLFEVADLWQEAHLAHVSGPPCESTTSAGAGDSGEAREHVKIEDVPPVGQGILLVTEHNAEVNAGFIVLFGSNHAPVVTEQELEKIPLRKGEKRSNALATFQHRLVEAYWKRVALMVDNGRDATNITAEECQAWVQTGLALAPFCGYIMNSSLDWAIAWSLVGEMTCRELFPPPEGAWPRNCQPRRLLSPYDQRSPPLHTWARACFEQGSLPSFLSLPGEASFRVLRRRPYVSSPASAGGEVSTSYSSWLWRSC